MRARKLFGLITALVGCVEPTATRDGDRYVLVEYDGRPIPADYVGGRILGGYVILWHDGRFEDYLTQEMKGGTVTDKLTGTWERVGQDSALFRAEGYTFGALLMGDRLTLTWQDITMTPKVFRYTKRAL